jgi:hypothetical protein
MYDVVVVVVVLRFRMHVKPIIKEASGGLGWFRRDQPLRR